MVDRAELNRLCQKNDLEGSLWRLVRAWDPDSISRWMLSEKARGNGFNPQHAVFSVAEVMSGAAFIMGQQLRGDIQGAIFGDQGLFEVAKMRARSKLDQVGGPHSILPAKPGIIIPGR